MGVSRRVVTSLKGSLTLKAETSLASIPELRVLRQDLMTLMRDDGAYAT